MIVEIATQLSPLVSDLAKRYKPQDVVSALLTVAFDLLSVDAKNPKMALNEFRAMSDTIARSRAGKPT